MRRRSELRTPIQIMIDEAIDRHRILKAEKKRALNNTTKAKFRKKPFSKLMVGWKEMTEKQRECLIQSNFREALRSQTNKILQLKRRRYMLIVVKELVYRNFKQVGASKKSVSEYYGLSADAPGEEQIRLSNHEGLHDISKTPVTVFVQRDKPKEEGAFWIPYGAPHKQIGKILDRAILLLKARIEERKKK